nr:hypothetical protein [Tanacetum cinerariifolium]
MGTWSKIAYNLLSWKGSFMIDGIDGKFSILPREGGDNDEKDDSLLDKDNVVLIDSSVADKLKILKVSEPLKVTGKRKQVISHVTPPSWKHHLKDLIMEKLNDIREKSYMRQVVLDNFMNRRTRFREESPCSGPSCRGCDFVGACGKAAWPASSVSYSALLLVVSNSNLRAYVNSIPSELTIISPAPEPSNLEAPLVRLKGVSPLLDLGDSLYAHNTCGSSSTQPWLRFYPFGEVIYGYDQLCQAEVIDMKRPLTCLATSCEPMNMARSLISMSIPIRRPASSVSYSALLLVVSNSNLRAYVNSIPSELTIISPAPEPSNLEAPLKKIKERIPKATKDVISSTDVEKKIIVNDQHPQQTGVIGKQLPTSFKRKLQELF